MWRAGATFVFQIFLCTNYCYSNQIRYKFLVWEWPWKCEYRTTGQEVSVQMESIGCVQLSENEYKVAQNGVTPLLGELSGEMK